MFTSPPRSLQDLQARIQHEVEILRADPAMVRRADMRCHCGLCIGRGGGHVEGVVHNYVIVD